MYLTIICLDAPFLRKVFDATQEMLEGKKYDTVYFHDMYLNLLKIDPDIIISQENAWKEMMLYKNHSTDPWGMNPSR